MGNQQATLNGESAAVPGCRKLTPYPHGVDSREPSEAIRSPPSPWKGEEMVQTTTLFRLAGESRCGRLIRGSQVRALAGSPLPGWRNR